MEIKHSPPKLPKSVSSRTLIQAGVLVGAIVISFCSGVAFQEHKKPTNVSTQTGINSRFGGNGTGRFGRRMSLSQVTAISSTSITVKDSNGNSKTYTINSDTQITKDRQTAAATDIAVGDDVAIVASTSDSTIASRIIDGFGGMMPQDGTTPSVNQNDLQTN